MSKTLFFSIVIGDVTKNDVDIRFNNYMNDYLIKNIDSGYSMIFIGAPGLGGEEYYLFNILRCFNAINIHFKDVLNVDENTSKKKLDFFIKNNKKLLYFLMGGNPYSQLKIIEDLGIKEDIKNYSDIVIGFCAGAINLSRYSIVTSDADFAKADSYYGIGRENVCIEPHYNDENDKIRNNELKIFSKKYGTEIYCIPDESIIYFEDGQKYECGKIYVI